MGKLQTVQGKREKKREISRSRERERMLEKIEIVLRIEKRKKNNFNKKRRKRTIMMYHTLFSELSYIIDCN